MVSLAAGTGGSAQNVTGAETGRRRDQGSARIRNRREPGSAQGSVHIEEQYLGDKAQQKKPVGIQDRSVGKCRSGDDPSVLRAVTGGTGRNRGVIPAKEDENREQERQEITPLYPFYQVYPVIPLNVLGGGDQECSEDHYCGKKRHGKSIHSDGFFSH